MASIKIKFRPSSLPQKEGTIYYQIIHNRIARQINTRYKLFPDEWDDNSAQIIYPPETKRKEYLTALKEKIEEENGRLKRIIISLDQKNMTYTSQEIVELFINLEMRNFFISFYARNNRATKTSG